MVLAMMTASFAFAANDGASAEVIENALAGGYDVSDVDRHLPCSFFICPIFSLAVASLEWIVALSAAAISPPFVGFFLKQWRTKMTSSCLR